MEIKETVELLQGPFTALDEIPCGRKDGMYYVLENSANIEKRENGNKFSFWDD